MIRAFAAFMVHLLTASGAAWALFALLAAGQGQWVATFLWLGLAAAVDAIDGPLARRLDVGATLPRWSGEVFDLVVDFLTYVFVPAYALMASGLLPAALTMPLGVLIVVTGVIYFGDRTMKIDGHYFRGFPALWNLVAFYLFVTKPWPAVSAAIVVIFAVATFLPIPVVHPFRVLRWRAANIAALMLAAIFGALALAQGLAPAAWVQTGLTVAGIYMFTVGLVIRER